MGPTEGTTKDGKPMTSLVTARIPVVLKTEAKQRASRAGVTFTEILSAALTRFLNEKK